MMESVVSAGLVLRRVRYLDYDFKLTLLLRDIGKVGVVSKGGQKITSKMKAVQEPFTEADFHVYVPAHGINGRLAGGRLVNSHQNLRQQLDVFQLASRCCEVVEALLPYRAPAPDVYDILHASLQRFHAPERHSTTPLHEWVLFVVRLLKSLGHGDVSKHALQLLTDAPMERCVSFVEAELEQILPRRLKSVVEVQ